MYKKLKLYGFFGFFKMFRNLVRTKIFFPQARIIRFPFDIRNRKYIKIGVGFTSGVGCRFEAHPEKPDSEPCLIIGKNVEVNDYVHIVARKKVEIGNNVLMAGKIFITDLNHGSYGKNDIHDSPETLPNNRPLSAEPVIIEDNVWIGEFVSILPGVRIGKGSIIGTMSVVSKNIPEFCIAAGSPAKVIKKYDFNLKKWIKA
jgi:lipopolysaccharide O-acetyltransferase